MSGIKEEYRFKKIEARMLKLEKKLDDAISKLEGPIERKIVSAIENVIREGIEISEEEMQYHREQLIIKGLTK